MRHAGGRETQWGREKGTERVSETEGEYEKLSITGSVIKSFL